MFSIPVLRHELKKLIVRTGCRTLPKFIIIGAQKAGTTMLYSYLAQHPSIARPAFKEAHFFDYEKNYSKGISRYALNFELPHKCHWVNKMTFEATPDYLYYPKCALRIKRDLGNVKLIVSLRDPVERAFSAWKMHHYYFRNHERHSWLYDPRTFEQAVQEELSALNNYEDNYSYLSKGLYANQLKSYFKYFLKKDILVLNSNDLKLKTQSTIDQVCGFLDLDNFNINNVDEANMFWDNKSLRGEQMEKNVEKKLKSFFLKPNEELENLLKQRFNW